MSGDNKTVLHLLTNNRKFFGGKSVTYKYDLPPGDYILLPNTMKAGEESQFGFQIFCSGLAGVRLVRVDNRGNSWT